MAGGWRERMELEEAQAAQVRKMRFDDQSCWFRGIHVFPHDTRCLFAFGYPDPNGSMQGTDLVHALVADEGVLDCMSWRCKRDAPPPDDDAILDTMRDHSADRRARQAHTAPVSYMIRGLRLDGTRTSLPPMDGAFAISGPMLDDFSRPTLPGYDFKAVVDVPVTIDGIRRWQVDLPFAFAFMRGGHLAQGTLPSADEVDAVVAAMEAAGLDRIRATLDQAALQTLSAEKSWTPDHYAFYAEYGQVGVRRRASAAAFPVMAIRMAEKPVLRAAAGGEVSFQAALSRWISAPLDTAHLRRINTLQLENDYEFQFSLSVLAHLPPDWMPSEPDEVQAMADVLACMRNFTRSLDLPHQGMVALLAASGVRGRWREFHARLAARVESMARPGQPAIIGLDQHSRRVRDMLQAFAAQIVAPVLANQGVRDDGAPGKADMQLAARTLISDKGIFGLLDLCDRWHDHNERRVARMPVSLPDGDGKGWPALCAPWTAPNGLVLVPLDSSLALVEEGAAGLDRNGVAGLSHCVGGYSRQCRSGDSHILSVREMLEDGSYHRLSTVEFNVRDHPLPGMPGPLHLVPRQHQARRDTRPVHLACKAVDEFMGAAIRGELELDELVFLPRKDGVVLGRNPLEGVCRYDWRQTDDVRQAMVAWEATLPRRLRNLELDGFAAILMGGEPPPRPAQVQDMDPPAIPGLR